MVFQVDFINVLPLDTDRVGAVQPRVNRGEQGPEDSYLSSTKLPLEQVESPPPERKRILIKFNFILSYQATRSQPPKGRVKPESPPGKLTAIVDCWQLKD